MVLENLYYYGNSYYFVITLLLLVGYFKTLWTNLISDFYQKHAHTHKSFYFEALFTLCMFSDGPIEERGATKTGRSSGIADRENNTTDGDITTKDTCGGIPRWAGHSEEKTGGQHQRPHQAAHAGLALFTSSSSFTIYWFTCIFLFLFVLYIFDLFIIYFILSPEIVRNYLKCNNVLLQNKLFMVKKDVKHQTGFEPIFYPCHQKDQSCLQKKKKKNHHKI